jgi:hypothetical protein
MLSMMDAKAAPDLTTTFGFVVELQRSGVFDPTMLLVMDAKATLG